MQNNEALSVLWQAASMVQLDMKNNTLLREAYGTLHELINEGNQSDEPLEANTEPQE